MSCICLDTNWFLKGLESPCPPDWTALSALFSENSDSFSLPRFPMQVHDVLLAYGIIENPNIRGVNRDLWMPLFRTGKCTILANLRWRGYLCGCVAQWHTAWQLQRCLSFMGV